MKPRPSRELLGLFMAAVAVFAWVGPASGG